MMIIGASFFVMASGPSAKSLKTNPVALSPVREQIRHVATVRINDPINAAPFLLGLFGADESWFGIICKDVFAFKMPLIARVVTVTDHSKQVADYSINQKYEVTNWGKRLVYYAEIVDSNGTVLRVFERTVGIEKSSVAIDSCVGDFARIIVDSLDPAVVRLLMMNVSGTRLSVMQSLGRLAMKKQVVRSADFLKLIDTDSRMVLAYQYAARAHEQEGDFSRAADLYKALVNLFPRNPDLYTGACRMYRRAALYDMAIYYATLAEKQSLCTGALLREKALALKAFKRPALAFEAFEKALTYDHADTAALVFCAHYYNVQGRYDRARQCAEQMLILVPRHGAASLELGKSLIAMGKNSEALAPLTIATVVNNGDPEAHLLMGDLLTEKEDFVSAAEHYRKAIPAMGDNIEATIKAAQAFEMAGDLQAAHRILKRFDIQTSIHQSLIQKKLGFIEYQLGDTLNAQKHFLNSLQNDQNDDRVFIMLGEINCFRHQFDVALQMYERALLISDRPDPIRVAMAGIYVKQGHAVEAIKLLNRVLVDSDTVSNVNRCMGDAVLMQGDTAHALRYYVRQRLLSGGDRRDDDRIAAIYYHKHDWLNAELEYRRIVKAYSMVSAEMRIHYAVTLLRQMRSGDAQKVLANVKIDSTVSDVALFDLGGAWLVNREPKAALDAYTACVKRAPLRLDAWKALGFLLSDLHRDSAAAEAFFVLFQLDQVQYAAQGIRAGHLFFSVNNMSRAKVVYEALLEARVSDRDVAANLATIEFSAQRFDRVIAILAPWNATGQLNEASSEILAGAYYQQVQFDDALRIARTMVDLNKNNSAALTLAAQSADKAGLPIEALKYYEALLSNSRTQNAHNAYRCAELYEMVGNSEKALTRYLDNTRLYEKDIGSYKRGGMLLMERKDWARAKELLEKALRTLPVQDLSIVKMAARTCQAQNNVGGALKYYHLYLEKAGNDSMAWYEVGSLLSSQQRYAQAIVALEKAASKMPWFGDVQYLLGHCYSRTGRLAEAVVNLSRAHAVNPGDQRIITSLVDCYTMQSNTDKLIILLEQWSKIDSNNSSIFIDLATYLLNAGNVSQAAIVIKTALRQSPNNVSILKLMARASRLKNDPERSFSLLREALSMASHDVQINYEIGCYYRSKGLVDSAAAYLQKALEIDPSHGPTRLEYARLLFVRNDYDAARYQLDQLLQLEPDNHDGCIDRAWLAVKLGQSDAALGYIRRVLANNSSPAMLELTGSIHQATGNLDSALYYYRLSISRDAAKNCNSCFIALGKLLILKNDYSMAQKCFDNALRIDPLNSEAIMLMGKLFVFNGAYDRALQFLAKAATMAQVPDENGYWLAQVYLKLGQSRQAVETCRRAAQNGESPWLRLAEGEIKLSEGRFDLALVSCAVAVTMMPDNPWALAAMGRAQLYSHYVDSALQYLAAAAVKIPNDYSLRMDLAAAYAQAGLVDSARNLYTSILNNATFQRDAYLALIEIATKNGNHEDAVQTARQAIAKNQRSAVLYQILGRELVMVQRYTEAIAALDKAAQYDKTMAAELFRTIAEIYYDKMGDQKNARRYYEQYLKTGVTDQKVKELLANL